MPFGGDGSLKFQPYQLWMIRYWLIMALLDNGKLVFDSGEGAYDSTFRVATATTHS
jgi:hypothetical protein